MNPCHRHEETLATWPQCHTSLVLEYVAATRSGRAASVDASCPHCLALIEVELPLPAAGYLARPVGTSSVLRRIATSSAR